MQLFRVVGSLSSDFAPVAAYPLPSEKFTRLEQLLANKQWQSANQETFAILSNICGLTHNRTIKISNLSCYDLHMIDSLWLKYSQGRFGFSIQQRVWQQICQDAIEIHSPQDQRWRALCDRLGWNAPPDLLNIPAGYFPTCAGSSAKSTLHPAVFTRLYCKMEGFRSR